VTSSHEAADHRIRDKEAASLALAGAQVTIIGADSYGAGAGNGIKIIKTPKATARLDRFLRQPWRCWSLASRLNADVIHLHDPELLQIVPRLKIRPDRPRIIYDVHEDFPELVRIRDYLPGLCRTLAPPAVDLIEKGLAGLVDAVIAVTLSLAARFGNRQREAIYNFPSRLFYEHAFRLSKPPAARTYDLVHLGTLSEARARFLVETLAILHHRKPSFTALITGAHSHIVRQLQALRPEGCTIEGVIPYDLVAERLGDARIGLDVHPFPTSNLRVALPVKVFEYMASGCAVVTSAMPVLTGLLNEHAGVARDVRVIGGGEPADYAASILDVLDRIQKGEEIGERIRVAAVGRYLWEKEAEKMIGLYRRLLAC
jgi:hypothetical protein